MIEGRVAEDGEQVESNLDSEQQQQDRREGYTITMDIFSGVHVLCRSLEQSRPSTHSRVQKDIKAGGKTTLALIAAVVVWGSPVCLMVCTLQM